MEVDILIFNQKVASSVLATFSFPGLSNVCFSHCIGYSVFCSVFAVLLTNKTLMNETRL